MAIAYVKNKYFMILCMSILCVTYVPIYAIKSNDHCNLCDLLTFPLRQMYILHSLMFIELVYETNYYLMHFLLFYSVIIYY